MNDLDKPTLVVLTGAGISAESGIQTFRDANGLWENHAVQDVASPEGWRKNPELVLQFYNQRRQQLAHAQPNAAHKILAALESDFRVIIITQNIDNLHEKAGSTTVIHLHGELTKVCSSAFYGNDIRDIGYQPITLGELSKDGSQLRPFVVWFGEEVPYFNLATQICLYCDVFVIIGTSLQVYPAAGLIDYVPAHVPKYLIDPNISFYDTSVKVFQEPATTGTRKLADELIQIKSNLIKSMNEDKIALEALLANTNIYS